MANPRNLDMFMYVPEPLLSLIVSSLPFEEAARTSVLSKRWQSVWYATRNIEFHESFFVKPEHSEAERKERRLAFLIFIQQWIQMHGDRSADAFRLSLSNPEMHVEVVSKAIKFALSRKVKVLDLDLSDPSWPEMGEFRDGYTQLWLCSIKNTVESLKLTSVDLMLESCTCDKLHTSLKSLSLAWINLPGERLNMILSVCPSLESLSLKKCYGMGFLEISNAPSLKTLVIEKCHEFDLLTGVLVDAPSLQFFRYSGWLVPFTVKNLGSLEEAALDFNIETVISFEEGELLYMLLRELLSAKVLTVCSYLLQAIQMANDPLMLEPQLENVRHLKLTGTELDHREYHGITFLLNSCPNLETLSIDISFRILFHHNEPPYRMEDHPFFTKEGYIIAYECVRKTLKVVQLRGYRGIDREERVLRYLLKYGCVLTDIDIHMNPSYFPFYCQRAQGLRGCPRASPNVRVSVQCPSAYPGLSWIV